MKYIMLFEEFSHQLDEMSYQLKKEVDELMDELSTLADKELFAEIRDFVNFQLVDPYITLKGLADRIIIRFEKEKEFKNSKLKDFLDKVK